KSSVTLQRRTIHRAFRRRSMRRIRIVDIAMAASLIGMLGCGSQPAAPPAGEPAPQLGAAKPGRNISPNDPPPASQGTVAIVDVKVMPCGQTPGGEAITQFVMTNSHGMTVKVINFGGILTAVEVPDKTGKKFENVTLNFPNLEGYFENALYFGGICGRF